MRRYHYRRNPDLLGFRLQDLAVKALGAMGTQFVNGSLVAPLISKFVPAQQGRTAAALDAATTLVSAKVAGIATGFVDARYRDDVEDGGAILAAGKALGVVLPGAGVSATFPSFLNRFSMGGAPAATAPAMASARAANTPNALPAAAATGGQVSNYAQPANVADDAGI